MTNQHASNIEALWRPDLVDKQVFRENCSFEIVDMDAISSKFDEQFDFCWSVCAFEHLGALHAGLEFVREATRVLKPGGVAVHTTEYNISDRETIDNWSTVLYQKRHFATLGEMIRDAGCRLVEIDFDPGNEFFDCYIDVPPYSNDQSNGLTLPSRPREAQRGRISCDVDRHHRGKRRRLNAVAADQSLGVERGRGRRSASLRRN